ncbi:DUF695 domain-containing protein [Solimonas sp. K1W22B-7]|uniref:DUF695 domain-containing protein n=1 Tax=Solimonas sp. K1W22B-7 TaxID=2303331 RepID=UPI000E333BCA|nr:DUF695 domain-containing protein [Solimonas sp. K1W22B-7]AXQ30538.1 DUF695 domain-containing protein [Solimonas sp. K1W22B-7]
MASEAEEEWTMILLEVEDERRLYRMRLAPPEAVDPARFCESVIVEWRYADAGLPDRETNAAMMAFEELLDALDDPAGNSLMLHAYTGAGIKEWCYYARDYAQFMRDLNTALKGQPRFPIEIFHDHDPVWKYWNGIKEFATRKE